MTARATWESGASARIITFNASPKTCSLMKSSAARFTLPPARAILKPAAKTSPACIGICSATWPKVKLSWMAKCFIEMASRWFNAYSYYYAAFQSLGRRVGVRERVRACNLPGSKDDSHRHSQPDARQNALGAGVHAWRRPSRDTCGDDWQRQRHQCLARASGAGRTDPGDRLSRRPNRQASSFVPRGGKNPA